MSKGDKRRPEDRQAFEDGYARTFGASRIDQATEDTKNAQMRESLNRVTDRIVEPLLRSIDIDSPMYPLGKDGASTLPTPKTCEHCKHFLDMNAPKGWGHCSEPAIRNYHEAGDTQIWLSPPFDFGCNRWEAK